jgi:hypothetical protein
MSHKFTQSLFKDLIDYQTDNLCGLILKSKWVHGQFRENSQPQEFGHYFEYLATGSLPKDGKIPKHKVYKNGARKGQMTDGYQRAALQAQYFKEILRTYKITLLHKGITLTHGEFEGTLDLIASFPELWRLNGMELPENNPKGIVIIDLKYSGLLDDRKNPLGWELKSFPYKLSPKIQSIHYTWLYEKNFGFFPPFMFWVFDSQKERRARIINANLNPNEIIQHGQIIHDANEYYKKLVNEDSFEPKPEYERCLNCSFKDSCSFKYNVPPVINVSFE